MLRVVGSAKPLLLRGLEVAEGAQWIRLDKGNAVLATWLGGVRGSDVSEKISALLREKLRQVQAEFLEPDVSDSRPTMADKASLLGLDAEEEETYRKLSRRQRLAERQAASNFAPPFVELTCSMAPGKAPWSFDVLTAAG